MGLMKRVGRPSPGASTMQGTRLGRHKPADESWRKAGAVPVRLWHGERPSWQQAESRVHEGRTVAAVAEGSGQVSPGTTACFRIFHKNQCQWRETCSGWERGFGSRPVFNLPLGLASWMTSGKLLSLSEPWVLHLLNGGENFKLKALFENQLK